MTPLLLPVDVAAETPRLLLKPLLVALDFPSQLLDVLLGRKVFRLDAALPEKVTNAWLF